MADLKISQFPDGGKVLPTDDLAAVRGGLNTRVQVGSAAAEDAGDAIDELLKIVDNGQGAPGLPPGITMNAEDVLVDPTGTSLNGITAQDALEELDKRATNYWGGTSGGTADAQTIGTTPDIMALVAGMGFEFIVGTTNTTTTTLDVEGLGPVALRKRGLLSNALVELAAGDLAAGTIARVTYNGTVFVLLNPQSQAQAADVTAAGTIDLSAAVGDVFNVVGSATTINGFTAAPGREFTLIMGNASTFKHDTALVAPTGADIVAVVGDVVKVRMIGAVSHIVGYQRGSGIPLKLTTATPAQGDVVYFDGTEWVNLAPGTANQVLQTKGAGQNPVWFTLPFTEYFESSNQTIPAAAGLLSVAHTLTGKPKVVQLWAVCTTAVNNWAIGDEILTVQTQLNSTTAIGPIIYVDDANNIEIRAAATQSLNLGNKTTGAIANQTTSNFAYKIKAFR